MFIVCRSRAENPDDFQYLLNTLISSTYLKSIEKKGEVVISGRGKKYSFSHEGYEGSQLDVVITTLNMLWYRCYI